MSEPLDTLVATVVLAPIAAIVAGVLLFYATNPGVQPWDGQDARQAEADASASASAVCDVEGHAWTPSPFDPAYVFCARCPAMAIWDDRTRVYELRRAA